MEKVKIELIRDSLARLSSLTLGSSLLDRIKITQINNLDLMRIQGKVQEYKRIEFSVSDWHPKIQGKVMCSK